MPETIFPSWESIHTIVFDFDGVFTDNKVWVDQKGNESVRCDRGDGLALDLLRRFIKENDWKLNYFILSKEKNPVVSARANKMRISCVQGNSNKADYLIAYLAENKCGPEGLVYVGNDLNDLAAMQFAGFSVAPSDAHPLIQQQANLVLSQKGGEGFVREFVEKLLSIKQLPLDKVGQLF
jgi:3-deoxy-D-manno-octulosonate 8-phosphate phosphatase (KDO 8-P phosphatase)